VEEQIQGVSRPLIHAGAAPNYRDLVSREGFPSLEARGVANFLPLGADPADDADFLRYPRASGLSRAGPDRTPVGAPAGK
jgi:hypothetical protein